MTINSPAAIAARDVPRGRREAGRAGDRAPRDDPERTSSRSTSPRRSTSSRPSPRCGSSRTWSSSARRSCRSGTRSRSRATTSGRRARRRPRSSRSRSPTGSRTSSGRSTRGMDVDEFAPRLSFFFNAHHDFFEEIAKFRAARRIWAREMRERFGARDPRSWLMRFHTQTAGCLADRAAALDEHRPDGDRGARGRPRRHPVAPHELASTRRSRSRPRTRSGLRSARSR